MHPKAACAALLLLLPALSLAQFTGGGDPFKPPQASVHYAPDRDYDLINVSVDLNVDWPHRIFSGSVVNTLAPLRDGLSQIVLDAGNGLDIRSVSIDGRSAQFSHANNKLVIDSGVLQRDRPVHVLVTYSSANAAGRTFGAGGGGWHWITPKIGDPDHVGFWTQGETGYNSNWVPTWDYPNDFTTSETRTTVPANWDVIGNGLLISNTRNGATRTFVWRMTQPHATYLLSLCGGPFDIARDNWRGVQLWYVVPKGEGYLIPGSFGHTQDMLSFYSDTIGFKYAWPKYAQDAMYDFGGGMENVSATTLGEPSLTDARAGYFNMDSLNSHELGHQWFGDTVTCKDWGQVWLNESFATYMQIMYFEHSRGRNGYDREIENAMQSYFREAKRYKRPVVTNVYRNPDAMFDSHTYPKGGVILHTLRKQLGDQPFFNGLHHYLNLHEHTPVETNDLCEAMTDASGINCHPFFDQWLYKPGHPVIDSTWEWNEATHSVVMHVKQTQDTSDGTPIYKANTAIGIIDGSHLDEAPIQINQPLNEFRISRPAKPDAVLFDPEHSFLREIPDVHWSSAELPFIFRTAPNGVDKTKAMRMMLDGPSPDLQTITTFLSADNSQFPAIESIAPLGSLKNESLRPFFEQQMSHPNFQRRGEAIRALGGLGRNAALEQKLRSLVNDKEPYPVVFAAMDVLASWDVNANMDVLMKATTIPSMRNVVRTAALSALARSHSPKGLDMLLVDAAPGKPSDVRASAVLALGSVDSDEPRSREAIRQALHDNDFSIVAAGLQATIRRRDKALIPDLQALLNRPDLPDPEHFKPAIENAIKDLSE